MIHPIVTIKITINMDNHINNMPLNSKGLLTKAQSMSLINHEGKIRRFIFDDIEDKGGYILSNNKSDDNQRYGQFNTLTNEKADHRGSLKNPAYFKNKYYRWGIELDPKYVGNNFDIENIIKKIEEKLNHKYLNKNIIIQIIKY